MWTLPNNNNAPSLYLGRFEDEQELLDLHPTPQDKSFAWVLEPDLYEYYRHYIYRNDSWFIDYQFQLNKSAIAEITNYLNGVLLSTINEKQDKSEWLDYSALSTVVGFSSFLRKNIFVLNMDNKFLFVSIDIEGISNSPLFSLTLPNNAVAHQSFATGRLTDNSGYVNNISHTMVSNGSNVLNFYKTPNQSVGFTSANYKACLINLILKIA